MKKINSLFTIEKAKKIISKHVNYQIETIKIRDLLNRYTAQKIYSPENFPSFDRSLYDGFAVNSKNVGAQFIEPFPISTGGRLPKGTDAVVMMENVLSGNDKIRLTAPVFPGENVLKKGEDIKKGQLLFPEKWKLRPQDIGILLGLSVDKIKVYKKLSVAIISSGNEITSDFRHGGQVRLPPSLKLRGTSQTSDFKIRDINSGMLSNLVLAAGGNPVPLGICSDNKKEIINFIHKALKQNVDLILFSGGTSVGKSDFLQEAIESIPGGKILFHGLNVKPGKPTLAGLVNSKLIIGLPGRPNSAFVVFHLLVKPVLNCFSFMPGTNLAGILTENVSSHSNQEEYFPVTLKEKKNNYYVQPLSSKPGLFSPVIFCQGLINIPSKQKGLKKGNKVEVTVL